MSRITFYSIVLVVVVFSITFVIFISNPYNTLKATNASFLPGSKIYEAEQITDDLLYYLHAGHSGKVSYHLNKSNKFLDISRKLIDSNRMDEALSALQLSDDHYILALLHSHEIPNTSQSKIYTDIVSDIAVRQNNTIQEYMEEYAVSGLSDTDSVKIAISKAVSLRNIR